MDNKAIFSHNLNLYMIENGKTRNDIAESLGISYFTVTDWVKGKKYPRMDKVEKLARYFGVKISDLVEKPATRRDSHEENTIADTRFKQWKAEFGTDFFSEKEIEQIWQFARFIKAQRKE